MTFLKLTVSYDGTPFFGWQKTKTGPSIQESLEKAVFQISRKKIDVEGASRTDRGVHAEGQIAHIALPGPVEIKTFCRSLNAVLPHEIRIQNMEEVSADFHPSLSAVSKTYRYFLCLNPAQEPIYRLYSWHFPYSLKIEEMKRAAKDFIGERDFAAFCNLRTADSVRTVYNIEIEPQERNRLLIEITGDRFIYKMARNIVGTLVYTGCGKIDPGTIPQLFESKDRKQTGVTAPAHGLYLKHVLYNTNSAFEQRQSYF